MNEYGKRVAKKMDNFMDEPNSVDREINDIQNAIEGYEVRGALAAGVKKSFDKSKTAQIKSEEATEITQNLLNDSFDTSKINANFEQRLDTEIRNLQPDWTKFKDETTSRLAGNETALKLNILEAQSHMIAIQEKNTFNFPKFERSLNNPLEVRSFPPDDPKDGEGYSLEFVTVLPAYRYLENPLDNYYLYAGSHDSEGIWLYTSPTPEGPFTLNSEAPVIHLNSVVWGKGHVSSPEVVFDLATKKVLLYSHSPMKDIGTKQPTGLHVSDDGVVFMPYGDRPVITNNKHISRWNGTSISYVRITKVGNEYFGVYQANGDLPIRQLDNNRSISIGVCYSKDGYAWELNVYPLKINDPNELGCFAPSIIYWNNYFVVLYGKSDGNIYGLITTDLTSETTYDIGIVFEKGISGSYTENRIQSPFFMMDRGILYMFYGFSSDGVGGFSVAKSEVTFS